MLRLSQRATTQPTYLCDDERSTRTRLAALVLVPIAQTCPSWSRKLTWNAFNRARQLGFSSRQIWFLRGSWGVTSFPFAVLLNERFWGCLKVMRQFPCPTQRLLPLTAATIRLRLQVKSACLTRGKILHTRSHKILHSEIPWKNATEHPLEQSSTNPLQSDNPLGNTTEIPMEHATDNPLEHATDNPLEHATNNPRQFLRC